MNKTNKAVAELLKVASEENNIVVCVTMDEKLTAGFNHNAGPLALSAAMAVMMRNTLDTLGHPVPVPAEADNGESPGEKPTQEN